MDIEEAYSYWSATYDHDRNLTRDLDQIVTRQVLSQLDVHSILELGCGTGKNTSFLAHIGTHVHAIDFSDHMLARARAKIQLSNVSFSVSDISQPWPCADLSIELISCSLVLEHIQDLSFIFSEAIRVLAKGGRFFICELHPFRQYRGIQANFQRDEETIMISSYVHHISDFINSAIQSGLLLKDFKEWWHDEDQNQEPRLVSFIFQKPD
jgi:malonyl-CoA O-methyltransferase